MTEIEWSEQEPLNTRLARMMNGVSARSWSQMDPAATLILERNAERFVEAVRMVVQHDAAAEETP